MSVSRQWLQTRNADYLIRGSSTETNPIRTISGVYGGWGNTSQLSICSIFWTDFAKCCFSLSYWKMVLSYLPFHSDRSNLIIAAGKGLPWMFLLGRDVNGWPYEILDFLRFELSWWFHFFVIHYNLFQELLSFKTFRKQAAVSFDRSMHPILFEILQHRTSSIVHVLYLLHFWHMPTIGA